MPGVIALMRFTVGVDPGLDGAFVLLDNLGEIQEVEHMPTEIVRAPSKRGYDLARLARIIERYRTARWCIEALHPFPSTMGGAQANFMRGYAQAFELALVVAKVRHSHVSAQQWQKVMLKGIPGKEPKPRAVARATQLWPDYDFRATVRCRKAHQGVVDAALIGEYGRTYR